MTHLLLILITALPHPASETEAGVPEWFTKHMAFMVRGSGAWSADNGKYKSERETADAYGMKWTYGVGKASLKGQLYSLSAGKRGATHWEMRLFWNPRTRRALLHQYGVGGTLMIAEVKQSGPGSFRAEAEIIAPDGSITPFADEHDDVDADTFHTRSYLKPSGEWTLSRPTCGNAPGRVTRTTSSPGPTGKKTCPCHGRSDTSFASDRTSSAMAVA